MNLTSDPIENLSALTQRLEALAQRYGRVHNVPQDGDWLVLKLSEEMGEVSRAWLALHGRTRHGKGMREATLRQDLSHELADMMCFLIVMAGRNGIDLNHAITEKWLQFEPVLKAELAADHV